MTAWPCTWFVITPYIADFFYTQILLLNLKKKPHHEQQFEVVT